jgi:hypothetical protein
MAATSRHYGDVHKWIERVIDSCTSQSEEQSARRLINLFGESLRQSGEVDIYFRHQMERTLRYRLEEKQYSRIETELQNGN